MNRRRDYPAPGEPLDWRVTKPVPPPPEHSVVDSWPFLVPGILIAVGILIARAQGWL